MSKAPDRCLYCEGDDPNCGFCEMGQPLDTQEDWDKSWGERLRAAIGLLYPDEMTPTSKRMLESILDDEPTEQREDQK